MKREGPDHPKTRLLADLLAAEIFSAVGLLEMLFHFTAKYAPRGDVGRFTDRHIAQGLGWRKDAGKLVAALVAAGWLDTDPTHRLLVHDWKDHADQAVVRKLARTGQQFAENLTSQRLVMASLARAQAVAGAKPEPEPEPEPEPGQANGSPPPPPAPPAVLSDIRAAQEACAAELDDTVRTTGHSADVLLVKASRTPSGEQITNIRNCTRLRWLEITTERLRTIRLGYLADSAHGLSPPGRKPTAEQQTLGAASRVVARHRKGEPT